ncbi:MAG TPA: ABC transporter permease [Ilumatobacteraceae bacterium]|jgi:spermidine/putrescine transport system permease protein
MTTTTTTLVPVVAATDAPPRRRRLRAPSFALAVPAIVWYVFFFVLPILLIIWYSFGVKNTASGGGVPVSMGHLTLQNYRDAFSPTFFTVFKSTLKISIIATTLCLVLGFPVAYFLVFKITDRWKTIMLALVVVPSFTSFLIRTLAWRIPLAANGEVSKFLQNWGIIHGPISILDTRTAVQIAIVYNYLGFMILPLFVALDRIDHHMREASKDLGANRLRTFLQVTMPLAGPGVAAGVMLTFIPMCGDFVTATLLGGTSGNMIGAMVDSQFHVAQNWPLGSAMAVMMIGAVLLVLVVGSIVVFGAQWFLRRRRHIDIAVAQ